MKWCHTDLGAVAYSWERMIESDLRFGELEGKFTGEDAMMAELLVKDGWLIDHETGLCLFDQGPNPQMCARLGGVQHMQLFHVLANVAFRAVRVIEPL